MSDVPSQPQAHSKPPLKREWSVPVLVCSVLVLLVAMMFVMYRDTSCDCDAERVSQLEAVLRDLRQDVQRSKTDIETLTGQVHLSPQEVYFNVKLSKHTSIKGGQTLIFDTVVSNIGDCYSLNNGTFRAPVQGLYQFTLTIMSQSEVSGKSISTHHQLMKQAKGSEPDIQGTELGHVYAGHAATSTITIATRLEEGDRVYAREQVWSTGHLYGNDYCHFTGLLIRS